MVIFIARNRFPLRVWVELALLQKEIERKRKELDTAIRLGGNPKEIEKLRFEIVKLLLKKNELERCKSW